MQHVGDSRGLHVNQDTPYIAGTKGLQAHIQTVKGPSLCRKYVVKVLAQQLRPQLEATVKHNDDPASQKYSPDAKSAARRALKNKALAYLAALGDATITQQVLDRFGAATNMTDKISALAALIDSEGMLSTPPHATHQTCGTAGSGQQLQYC